jgi:hypothetical protein
MLAFLSSSLLLRRLSLSDNRFGIAAGRALVLALVWMVAASWPAMAGSAPATTTTLAVTSGGSAVTTVASGSVVTLTATVAAGTAPVTTGQVMFCDATAKYCEDIHLLGTAQLTNAGTAVFKFRPGVSSHSYKAVFAGTTSAANSASAPSALRVTGLYRTTTTLAQSGSAGSYTLTSSVSGVGPLAPTGTVSFLDTSNGNSVLGTGTLGTATSELNFLAAPTPTDGQEMRSFAVGDFNRDGILDLAVEDSSLSTLTVLLGNGDGTFTSGPTTAVTGPIWAVGDFNGDGILDLVTANIENGGPVTVFLGDGTGNFTPKTTTGAIPGEPSGFAVGDFNGDGILDLVVATPVNLPYSGGVTTLLGKGDGTFTVVNTTSYSQAGEYPGGVAVGDFTGNGILDLAIGNMTGNYVTVLLGDGHGHFTASSNLTTGPLPGSIVAGDFTGNGILDLAVVSITGNSVTVLMGKGDGSFTATAASPQTGKSPGGIALGDFNGDGLPDLAVANEGGDTLTILLGNGDGTFTATATSPQAGSSPVGPLVGDFNGDGIPDFAILNNGVYTMTILLTQPTQVASATANGISPLGTGTHQVVASYPENSNFRASMSAAASLTAQKETPTVQVTPSSSNITTAQPLTVTVTVTAASGNLTPTGTVMLTSGVYTSLATNLNSGNATINIPAGSLAAGSDNLTVTYTADSASSSFYNSATGSSAVMVTIAVTPSFAITGTAVTVTPGATSGNTSTVTVTPAGGFTGSVTLAAAVTSSPTGAVYPPTVSFGSTGTVNIAGATAGTATITISTTAPTSAALVRPKRPWTPWYAAGGAALACLLLFGIPARRRSWRTMLGVLVLFAALAGGVSACGGSSANGSGGGGSGGGGGGTAGTTAGTYAVTVTATSGTTNATGMVTLIVQ